LVTSQRGHVFELLTFDGPPAPIQWAIFRLKICFETRRSAASIEPLIDLPACLEPKLWPKDPIFPQNQKIAENATAACAIAITLSAWAIAITRR